MCSAQPIHVVVFTPRVVLLIVEGSTKEETLFCRLFPILGRRGGRASKSGRGRNERFGRPLPLPEALPSSQTNTVIDRIYRNN